MSSKDHLSWVEGYYRRKPEYRRKPAMLGRDKLDNTLFECDQGNFNQTTAWSRNQTLVTVVRGRCTNTVPPLVL